MMSLTEMVTKVRIEFLKAGYTDLIGDYINRSRNYLLSVDGQSYLLKWDLNHWMSAGSVVPEIGRGPGRTVNQEVYDDYIKRLKATTLFGRNKNDIIQSITYEKFEQMGENHLQYANNEWVRVVSSAELKVWKLKPKESKK